MAADSSSSVGHRDDVGGCSVVDGPLQAKGPGRGAYGDPSPICQEKGADGNFNPGAGWQNGNNDTKEMHGRQTGGEPSIYIDEYCFLHLSEHS